MTETNNAGAAPIEATAAITTVADIPAVVGFWREAGFKRWFSKDAAFDDQFRERFLATHEAATDGRLDDWADTPEGALALLILLDQFPRNCFRGDARSYATDTLARGIADKAIERGFDTQVDPELRMFFFVPFSHSEDIADQDLCVALHEEAGMGTKFALIHRDVIRRFGRFPHRNALLGRQSTPEELEFLEQGGFAG